jgi:hypothetical protein
MSSSDICLEKSPLFSYKVNMICIYQDEEQLSVAIFIVNCIMLVLLVKIGFESEKYRKRIVSPLKVVLSYKETYCVHSVRIVRWTQVLIFTSIWCGVFNAFTCIIGPNYRSWFLNEAFKDCLSDQKWY